MRQAIDKYKLYGKYTNTDKMLPSIVDGLLPVHRRVLVVLHSIASKSKMKTATVIGELVGKYHPHETGIGPATWAVNNQFAIGYGQWGSDIGVEEIEPAASRYTEMKSDPFIEDNVMSLVKYVDWEINEMDFEEPNHLPTMFPFCLMGKKELSMIGFGVKTEFPIYKKIDLLKRLLFLLHKTDKNITIKPDIPNCEILTSIKDLKDLLISGECSVQVKGKYVPDEKNNQIYIYGWNPRTKFETIYNSIINNGSKDKNFGHIFDGEGIGYIDESTLKDGTKIRFEVLKQRNVKESYNVLLDAIDKALTSNIRYSMYVVDDCKKATSTDEIKFKLSSVDEMLLICYNHYKNTYQKYCEDTINRLTKRIEENINIEKIKPHISNVKLTDSIEINIKYLSKQTGLDESTITELIEKYNIKKLLTINTDRGELNDKLSVFKDKLNNLESNVLLEYKNSIMKEKE